MKLIEAVEGYSLWLQRRENLQETLIKNVTCSCDVPKLMAKKIPNADAKTKRNIVDLASAS